MAILLTNVNVIEVYLVFALFLQNISREVGFVIYNIYFNQRKSCVLN